MFMDDKLLNDLVYHYNAWTDDNQIRTTRKNGWNDITDAYYGKLPNDWPFLSKVVDPRIRTTLIEKNARLVNGKLKGRLVPRESSDLITSQIQNALLDYQWDNANNDGSMHTKLGICDIDTRLYQSKFGLVTWRFEQDESKKILFDGNEFTPLDIRDCGMDFSAKHIRGAKWFQHRAWEFLEDLEKQVDTKGEPIFKNLDEIKQKIKANGDKSRSVKSSRKSTEVISRVKELRSLEDREGTDPAFPVVEIVTEYREDRWITFCPQYKTIIRDIPNPYAHGKIPVVQLRYYPLQDDALGESEVETVLPLWKAIQACMCSYLDEVMLKSRPPLKILEGQVRIETIQYGPEAQWIMSRPDAVTEMQSNGEATRYFQTTYSALVSAFNTAMGDMSQGTSNADPLNQDKTATEIKAIQRQQSVRDQKNQSDLAEFIKDIMSMWLSNNQQFLFANLNKQEYIMRIVGQDKFNYLKRAGLADMEVSPENMSQIADIVSMSPDITDVEMMGLMDAGKTPLHPVIENPKEKDPEKLIVKPKMRLSDMGDVAEVSILPSDLEGTFDYIPDVKSMGLSATEELMQARQKAIEMFTSNPTVLTLLQQEGYRPKLKEILSANFEDFGLNDSERFFEKYE